MDSEPRKADLFGGAITANLPSGFGDVSTIRQVPDHQEVYLAVNGFASIVVEITERVTQPPTDQEALTYHFNEIVTSGDESKIWESSAVQLEHLPPMTPAWTLIARTKPAVPPTTPMVPTSTTILLTLIRLVSKSTDLVITINLPNIPAESDTEVVSVASFTLSGEESRESVDFENGHFSSFVEEGMKVRDEILRTLRIEDWSLFGEE
ncbi:MAG: hypothetical protein Q9191_001732 [Dirinaria sp. TL-2023a]